MIEHTHTKSEGMGYRYYDCHDPHCPQSGPILCDDIVRGDYRSPNGAGQNAPCTHKARFIVTCPGSDAIKGDYYVCGQHVRAFERMNRGTARTNESMADTDRILGRPARAPFPDLYVIRPIDRA